MTISALVVLLARLFAIAVGIYTVSSFINSLIFYTSNDTYSTLALGYFSSLLLLSVIIWFAPLSFIRLLTGQTGNIKKPSESMSAGQFANIAFAILAMYLLYRVISDIGYWSFFYLNFEANEYYLSEITLDQKSAIFATALELVFIMILLVGRKKIFELMTMLRS